MKKLINNIVLNIKNVLENEFSILIVDSVNKCNNIIKKNQPHPPLLDKANRIFNKIIIKDISKSFFFNEEQERIVNTFQKALLLTYSDKTILIPWGFLLFIIYEYNVFFKECIRNKIFRTFIYNVLDLFFHDFLDSLNSYLIIFVISCFFYISIKNSCFNFFILNMENYNYFIRFNLVNLNINLDKSLRVYMNYAQYNKELDIKLYSNVNHLIAQYVLLQKN